MRGGANQGGKEYCGMGVRGVHQQRSSQFPVRDRGATGCSAASRIRPVAH
jgi:hypothetical protein